ncbi:hypothetical protein E2C01_046744 [Portunus trituberculatus]|uniref:Uncharacterized protein n=1 Tax=Portunus trituberculatus TaxID=210409 RepID=A0A5B7G5W6_PORTR|nr:hypothetical protein [Portunus trituberculatus]
MGHPLPFCHQAAERVGGSRHRSRRRGTGHGDGSQPPRDGPQSWRCLGHSCRRVVPHREPEIRVSRRGGPELILILRQLDATPHRGASPAGHNATPAGHAIVTTVISATDNSKTTTGSLAYVKVS